MNSNDLLKDPAELNNTKDMLKDVLQGDDKLLTIFDNKNLDLDAIKTALDFLLKNKDLSNEQKASLLKESWRINYRGKPPTPHEFLTEKYLGPVANHTYDRIKNVFFEFMDPNTIKLNLILYPHIGWGKQLSYDSKIYTPCGFIKAIDIQVGDKVVTPNGNISNVINKRIFEKEPLYRVEFEDNRTVLAGGPHYWKCTLDKKNWVIITTEKLIEDIKQNPQHIWYIPNTEEVFHNETIHKISSKNIGKNIRLKLIKKILPGYKYDSIQNRRDLINELFKDSLTFESINIQLIDDIAEIAYGLGLSLTKTTNQIIIKSLKRTEDFIQIVSIQPTDQIGGVCIETDDSERLFLTDNYIVTHNSYLSTLITLYISTCVSLMRSPWKYFGLNPATQLCQLLCSYSIKKSSELLLEPYFSMLENSPFFEKVRSREGMVKKNEEFIHLDKIDKLYYTTASPSSDITFSSGVNIKCVSSLQSTLGLSVLSACLSELAFFDLAGKSSDYIMQFYNDVKSRINTRMKGNYWGKSILDSSPNDLNNAIDDYIINKAPNDPSNYIVKGSMWEWEPEDFDMSQTFKVYSGGRGNPPRILEDNDILLKDPNESNKEKIIDIPLSLKQYFVDDLVKSLKDRAGIPSGSADNLIYDYSLLEKGMFNNSLKNIYSNIYADSKLSPNGLIWNKVSDVFFKNKAGQYEFYYKPYIPRCIGVDLSINHDLSAISCSHVEKYGDTGDNIYVIDFTIVICPEDSNGKVNIEAVKCFIEDLKEKGHMLIEAVSFDSFQSETSIQSLDRFNIPVEKISVDRSMDPYLHFISLINSKRVVCGRNIFLKNNLKSLHIIHPKKKGGKPKVDHDNSHKQVVNGDSNWDTSQLGCFGKDCSDAVCQSIELNKNHFSVASDTWDPKYLERFNDSDKKIKLSAEESTKKLLSSLGLFA